MNIRPYATIALSLAMLCTSLGISTPAFAQVEENPQKLPNNQSGRAINLSSRAAAFRAAFPAVSVGTWLGHDSVYGPAWAFGETVQDSVESFRKEMLPMFGIAPEDLVPGMRHLPENQNTVQLMPDGNGGYKFTAVYYTQHRDGIEVFGTAMVGLVRNEAAYPLVLAKTAMRDIGDFRVNPQALRSVNANAAYQKATQHLIQLGGGRNPEFTIPRTVIFAGVNDAVAPINLALEFIGMTDNVQGGFPIHRRFVSDAVSGVVLYTEDLIHEVDISGNVSGRCTPGYAADPCSPPPVILPVPYAKITAGATTVFADASGNYVLPNAGATPVSVTATLNGPFFNMKTCSGSQVPSPQGSPCTSAPMSLTSSITPPGPGDFLFNDPDGTGNPGQFARAELNAYIHSNIVRDFILANHPTFPTIAAEQNFAVNVNLGLTCNAFYSSSLQSINFYITGGGCNNTSFSNVVHHEYGHRVVNAAGSGQGQYGEGMGDTIGNLISDLSCTGSGFQTCGVCLREGNNNHQFPQNGAVHESGRLISGCVWSTRNYLAATYPATYRQILNPLIVNSIPLHVPTSNTQITPQITIDVLTLDDNDANLANGTPHYEEINHGFSDHNMAGPPVTAAILVTPTSGPTHQGIVGGPYTNNPFNYTMENNTPNPADYTVETLPGGTAPLLLNGSSGPVNGTMAGAQIMNFPVSVDPAANALPAGIYTTQVRFSDTTNNLQYTRTHTLEIGQVGFTTTPANGLVSGGPVGGPFNATQVYTLTSTKPTSVTVRVQANGAPWISLDGGAGPVDLVLNGIGASAQVTVGFSAAATSLPAGEVNSTVTMTNIGSGGNASDTSRPISLDVGRFTYAATDLPIPICDLCTNIISNITVPDIYCVGDVDVQVDITHTYQGDLTVEVINPQGTVVRLHNRTGAGADNIHKLYSDEGPNLPDGPGALSNFDGLPVGGVWKLRVSDLAGQDVGTIDGWQLKIAASGAVCPPIATNVSATIPVIVTSNVTLAGTSTVTLTPDFVLMSPPLHGALLDPNGGLVTVYPYTLLNQGKIVRFKPDVSYAGNDSFSFRVSDGQNSNTAVANITIGGPQTVHLVNMNTNPGWSGTVANEWAFGQPTGGGTTGRLDPTSGFNGPNVYGYNLAGHYTNNLTPTRWLTSTAFDMTGVTQVELRFRRWLGIESATYDHAYVEMSTNGTTWTGIYSHVGAALNEQAWTLQNYSIPLADNQPTVYLRWGMGVTDISVTYQGWNIDEVEMRGIRPPCLYDCANNDRLINIDDLVAVITAWGPGGGYGPADVDPPGGNGTVDIDDLVQIITHWGSCD